MSGEESKITPRDLLKRLDELEKAITERLESIAKASDASRIADEVRKAFESAMPKEVSVQSMIDDIVKHTTVCSSCRDVLFNTLAKYYKTVEVGRGGRRKKA